MAEARRIAITTVGSLKKDKKPKESAPTLRFNLALVESNDKTCPEFNYNDLVKSSRLKNNSGISTHGEEIQEDDKLRALAKKFEAKYNPRPGKKQKKNIGRIEDYIDLGMGYDENDPFIDNTDAYDELVPSTLTTQHGGFYINSGKLNFKEVDSSDETSSNSSDFEMVPDAAAAKKRRRRLKDLEKDKRRKRIKLGDGQKKKALKMDDKTESALLKLKKAGKQPTVASLLLQHKTQQPIQSTMTSNVLATSSGQTGPGVVNVSNGKLANSTIVDAIESVINASRDHNSIDAGLNTATGSSDSEMATSTNVEPEEEANKLPDNLPPDLDCLLKMIKETAEESKEGKCKFFSNDVNNILLEIELKTRQLVCSQRSMVYSHLASHLPCTKETLLKRVKKLRLEQEGGKLKEPMAKLRHAISIVMPVMLEKYKLERQKILPNIKDAINSESDDLSDSDSVSEKETQITNRNRVRRKFEWNDNLRRMLVDIVRIKMKCYEVSKTRSQSAEEFLRQFLQSEVKHLWPKCWMQTRILYKESGDAHSYLTYAKNKPKRPLSFGSKKFLVSSMLGVPDVVTNKPTSSTSYLPNGIVATTLPTPVPALATPINWSAKALPTKPTTMEPKSELPVVISVTSSSVVAPTTSTTTCTSSAGTATIVSTSVSSVPKSSAPIVKVLATETSPKTTSAPPPTIKSDVFSHSTAAPYHEMPKSATAPSVIDSITVSSLLKQSSGGGAQQHSLKSLVGGLKYRAMDYSESLQAAAVLSNPSPNDVLDQIIHASLADFPSSGASKLTLGDAPGNSVAAPTQSSSTPAVGASYGPVKHVSAVNPVTSSRSLLKTSSTSIPTAASVKTEPAIRETTRATPESFPGHSARTAPAPVAKISVPVADTSAGAAKPYTLERGSAAAKSFTTPYQSVFEFPEAIERTLQGKASACTTTAAAAINYGLYAGLQQQQQHQQQNFRKEQNDLVISSLYSQFAVRKEANELSPHLASFAVRKDLLNEQPLNFSPARHPTGPPTSTTTASNCAFNNRVSPVPTYSSPLKDGSLGAKAHAAAVTYTSPSVGATVRQTSGSDNIFASSPHTTYVSTSPIQTTAQVTRPTTTAPPNHTLYARTGSPNQNKLLHYTTGMDYNTTLSQVLNPSWQPTTNPSTQSVYNRHYAKMLPHVGLQTTYPTTTSKAGSLIPHHGSASSRNPPSSTPSYDQGSSF